MFKRSRGGKPIPRNERAVRVARKTIEHLGPTQQRTLQNAITGDGRHSLLYIPRQHGIACTCVNEDPLDANGKMNPDFMVDLLSNANVGVTDYRTGMGVKPETNNGSDHDSDSIKKPSSRPAMTKEFSMKVFSLDDLDDENFDADDLDLDVDAGFSDEEKIPTLQNGFIPTAFASATACPLCLGTGWVGGYELHGGNRIVLAASSADSLNGCKVVDGTPRYVEMAKGTSFKFDSILLPAGVTRVDEIAMWDHRDKIAFQLRVDGNLLADLVNLDPYFDGFSHSIEFIPLYNTNVTHVTFQYGTADLLIDVSTKTISTNNKVYDQQQDVTLVLPVITQKDLKGAIVYDSSENKLYRVSSMATSNTQGGWVQKLDLDARIVQPYELVNLLPKMSPRNIKRFGGSFNHTSPTPKKFY